MKAMKGFAASLVALVALILPALPLGAQAQALCVSAARANLRAGPGKNFRVTWEVNRYMPLVPIDRKGKWLKVKDVDGDTHWVFETLVKSNLDCVTIRKSKANIRRKPSARGKKLFTVEKYTSFKRVGGKPKWVKIEYEGKVMWVYYTLVWPSSS